MGLLRQEGLLLGVATDFALRQRLSKFRNLCHCKFSVVAEIKIRQLREFGQDTHIGECANVGGEGLQCRELG